MVKQICTADLEYSYSSNGVDIGSFRRPDELDHDRDLVSVGIFSIQISFDKILKCVL